MPRPVVHMLDSLKKCFSLISRRERWQWFALLPLAVVAALLESLGAVAVFTLIKLVSEPSRIDELHDLPYLGGLHLPASDTSVVLLFTVAVGFFYVFKSLVLTASMVAKHRVMHRSAARLSQRMLRGYLALPYAFHLQRNSAELLRNLTFSVDRAITGLGSSALHMATEFLIIMGFFLVLFFAAPLVTTVAAVVVFASMCVLLGTTRRCLLRLGIEEQGLRRSVIQAVEHAFGALKEVKVMQRESFFYSLFSRLQQALYKVSLRRDTIAELPRIIVETVFVCGMLLVIGLIAAGPTPEPDVIPLLGLFAYAGFRLVPSIIGILVDFIRIRNSTPAIHQLHGDLERFAAQSKEAAPQRTAEIPFKDRLVCDHVCYRFPEGPFALQDIDFSIKRGESLGVVGETGAGKSTLVNLMLGLLRPTSGRITVDGYDIQERLPTWFAKVGYVPQDLYLIDDSLRRNIAFGRADDEIVEEKLESVLRLAHLESFVRTLPHGLDTLVGERGVRLSGGQRQRVAIARTLYDDPELVVFDEATSSLDNQTEREITRNIETLQGQKTLVIVAHRLSTIRLCDRLIFLRKGRIEGCGTFDELIRNGAFSGMVSGLTQTPRTDAA